MRIAKTVLLATLLAAGMACGYSSKATTPTSPGTMPNISQLVPDNTNAGSASFVLTVNGTSFNANAAINWNGTAVTTTHVSANQLTATIPSADVATAGTAAVTLTNPGSGVGIYGGGTATEPSNSMTFTVN